MTEKNNVNSVTTTSIGLEPWGATYSIENTTIENFVVSIFSSRAGVTPVGAYLTDTQPGRTSGRDLQDTLSLVAFFDYNDFTGTDDTSKMGSISPIFLDQMPVASNIQPKDSLKAIISRIGKVINRKPVKYIVTPKGNGHGPLVKVTLDLHAILRMMLQARVESYVVSILASDSTNKGDQVIIDVLKAIASNSSNSHNNNDDLRELARSSNNRGSRGFNRSQPRR